MKKPKLNKLAENKKETGLIKKLVENPQTEARLCQVKVQ
jgi:hypothetical protein